MPRMPPVITTHSLFETATATRIESMAKTMSVSSTFTTVAQNGERPSQGSAGLIFWRSSPLACPKKCWYGRYSR